VAFVRAALDAGEPVAVAVPRPNLALIRDALGRRAAGVHTLDMTVAVDETRPLWTHAADRRTNIAPRYLRGAVGRV
jgi:hypothetical protein